MMNSMKVKSSVVMLAVLVLACLASCATQRGGNGIPYKEAHNYFFRNDASIPSAPVCSTQADFDKLYGVAAFMGKDGQPTQIDFSRQFVIGIVLSETSDETTIIPGKLTRSGGTLTLQYSVQTGEKNRTYTILPIKLLVVDNKYKAGNCVLLKK